jgi:23S rRNA (cytidine1920-2'-O)/16S rRNA (cytidine1409-2'-O)-methyltransferase
VQRRLDAEMVRRGLAASRQQAQALVEQGVVLVGGALAEKPARLVAADAPLRVLDTPRFVSRGGEKLDAALDRFGLSVAGRRCLDAGASTGGFTDCLLQRGAAAVVAVDVGYGQLHPRLQRDPRVTQLDRTNIRYVSLEHVGGVPFETVVADVSFISLTAVLPVLAGELAADRADIVVLVKPQFEAGRAEASRGKGVIRDPSIRAAALQRVASAAESAGASIMGTMESPIPGRAGNIELLLHARIGSREIPRNR